MPKEPKITQLAVYDPPMSCSSGVCGPDMDESLSRFSDDLIWAGKNGIRIERYNLGHEPAAFATNPLVRSLLEKDGMGCLPLVIAGSEILAKGGYPTTEALASKLGIATGD